MKTIKCDICGTELGKELSRAEWGGWWVCERTEYPWAWFYVNSREEQISDVCLDCWNKIAVAQNTVIKEIKWTTKNK